MVMGVLGSGYAASYVGADKCMKCHGKEYNEWRASGHPYKIRTAEEIKSVPIPLPAGYSWEDISYVVGGYKWKARYLDKKGFIITKTNGKPGKNQYNLQTGTWSDYHPGEVKKYNCGRCHTTGYSKEGSQGGLEGIVGTWKFEGIQCEACHGPGSDHIAQEGEVTLIKMDESSELCGQCHVRGSKDKIPAKGGFIRHHEQYNELLASPKKPFNCVSCHNPHKKAEFALKQDCTTCHAVEKAKYAGSKMEKVGVRCIDCHMPKTVKSAVKFTKYEADVRSHLFTINLDPEAEMFTADGKLAQGYLTVEYSCFGCHKDRDKAWALEKAKTAHSLGRGRRVLNAQK
jgi:hypothetical protein